MVKGTTRLRRLLDSDIPWMLAGLRQAAAFAEMPDLFPSEEHAVTVIRRVHDQGLLWIAEVESCVDGEFQHRPVGFLGAFAVAHDYNPEVGMAGVAVWWVDPEYRHGRAGAMLLKRYIDAATVRGCRYANVSLGPHTPIREESLLRRGFRLQERVYTLTIG